MAQLKLLSIIIPVYNGESYISHIVNSICNYNIDIINEIEIILVNDGSVDKSDQLCLELPQNPAYAHYFNKIEYSRIADHDNNLRWRALVNRKKHKIQEKN